MNFSISIHNDDDIKSIQLFFENFFLKKQGFSEVLKDYDLELDRHIIIYPVPEALVKEVLIFIVPSDKNDFIAAQVCSELGLVSNFYFKKFS